MTIATIAPNGEIHITAATTSSAISYGGGALSRREAECSAGVNEKPQPTGRGGWGKS
jgi:hypothetical protein